MVRVLLRLEGLAVCALAVYGYAASGGHSLWFAVLLLAGFLLAAHIGVDLFLGFGLRYPSGFKDTHVQRV